MTHEPIAERLEHDWDAFRSHLHHHGVTMQPAIARTPPEAAMSLISTLETDFEDVRAKVVEFAETKLPAATADLKKLETLLGNPAVDALFAAAHVPIEAIAGLVVPVIDGLAALYQKPAAAPAEQAVPAVS